MDNGVEIEKELDKIERLLKKGEKLDEAKMKMLFFFSFLQEEGTVGFAYAKKQID